MTAIRLTLLLLCCSWLNACMYPEIHQGNRLKPQAAMAVHAGMTQYEVEGLLGSPILTDVLHPNRATYLEYYLDRETKQHWSRRLEVYYSSAKRVQKVRVFDLNKTAPTRLKP